MTATTVRRVGRDVRVELADGRRVVVRRLTPADEGALVAAFERADRNDLRRRFMGPPPPASLLLRWLERIDNVHDLVTGAFADNGRLVGVAQFDRSDDAPVAEVAIEVAHDWQKDGLGTVLLTEVAREAVAIGVVEFTATYFADNLAIIRLLHDVGHVVSSEYEYGEGTMRIDLRGLVHQEPSASPEQAVGGCS
jgi:L-amino acid N-acyltransferase YncA